MGGKDYFSQLYIYIYNLRDLIAQGDTWSSGTVQFAIMLICRPLSAVDNLRKQPTFGNATTGFPANDIWETRAEIPYWWQVTTQIWVVLLVGWSKFSANQNTTQISVVRCHQYGISALVSQTSFNSRRNQGWRRIMSTVLSGYAVECLLKF